MNLSTKVILPFVGLFGFTIFVIVILSISQFGLIEDQHIFIKTIEAFVNQNSFLTEDSDLSEKWNEWMSSYQAQLSRTQNRATIKTVSLVAVSVVSFMLAISGIHRNLIRRLQKIREFSLAYDPESEQNARLTLEGSDELNLFARIFNKLVDRVYGRETMWESKIAQERSQLISLIRSLEAKTAIFRTNGQLLASNMEEGLEKRVSLRVSKLLLERGNSGSGSSSLFANKVFSENFEDLTLDMEMIGPDSSTGRLYKVEVRVPSKAL